MNRTAAITDTARDEWSVLAAFWHEDLPRPSFVDFADLIQTVENEGAGQPATLAWILSRSPELLPVVKALKQHAEDAGTLMLRGNGVLLGALCDRDIESLIDAPDEVWEQIEEVIPTGLAPDQLSSMLSARIERTDDDEYRTKLESVLEKVRASQRQTEKAA